MRRSVHCQHAIGFVSRKAPRKLALTFLPRICIDGMSAEIVYIASCDFIIWINGDNELVFLERFIGPLHGHLAAQKLVFLLKEDDVSIVGATNSPVREDEKKVVLKLEVPGIEEKDLDVSVENSLTVKGERKFEKEEKEENFHRIERRYGSFYRAFSLPTTVDTENIAAKYDAGVLKLELTKKPEAQPKQIKVNVAA